MNDSDPLEKANKCDRHYSCHNLLSVESVPRENKFAQKG